MREMLKFGVVGAVAFVVDIGVFNMLRFGFAEGTPAGQPLTAKIISVTLATLTAWLGNRYWTFRHRRQRQAHHELMLFIGFNLAGMAIASPAWPSRTTCWTCAARWPTTSAPTASGSVLGTLFRFWAYRWFVFAGEEFAPDGDPGHPQLTSGSGQPPPPRTGTARRSRAGPGRARAGRRWTRRGRGRGRGRDPRPAPLVTERSKMCGAMVGGTPSPWSLTSTTTDGPLRRACTSTVPRPCAREFSRSVESTCDSATGVADHQPALAVDAHAAPGLLERRLPLLLQRRDDRVQRDRRRRASWCPRRVRTAGRRPRGSAARPARWRCGPPPDHVGVVGRQISSSRIEQRGQGRPQLVGGVGGEVALGGQRPVIWWALRASTAETEVDLVDAGEQRLQA